MMNAQAKPEQTAAEKLHDQQTLNAQQTKMGDRKGYSLLQGLGFLVVLSIVVTLVLNYFSQA
jgi:hypothetical protein|tara:strand:+ start:338 stop:523 length:186 start_codon:yes stop_codon:yes gene_type:complete